MIGKFNGITVGFRVSENRLLLKYKFRKPWKFQGVLKFYIGGFTNE